jgi:hypothetical protein
MHKEMSKDGLVLITISVDENDSKETALNFLKTVGATTKNYLLVDTEENIDKGQKTLETKAIPMVHVYDRSGKFQKTFEGSEKPAEFDKFVTDLLKAK